jgi:hypothetical protein
MLPGTQHFEWGWLLFSAWWGLSPFIHLKIRTESKSIADKSKSVVEFSYLPFSCAIATILIVAYSQMWAYSWMVTVISH